MFPDDPNVQIALIGGAVTIIGAIIALVGNAILTRLGKVEKHASEAKWQVKNSHDTNLRDDLDDLHDDVRLVLSRLDAQDTGLRQHAKELGGLREDMRVERTERIALASRVDAPLVQINSPATAVTPEPTP